MKRFCFNTEMKIALAQLNYHIGNFEQNTAAIIKSINKAKETGVDIVVFSELAICGYPPQDFLDFNDFINRSLKGIETIAKECIGIAAIVGSPSVNPELEGKNLFNSAFFLADGKIYGKAHKALLPTYDVFDEYRYFEPNKKFDVIEYKGVRIALTICEDLWNVDDDPLYVTCPMDELIKQNPDVMINIAASPFNYNQAEIRKTVMLKNVSKYKLPLFYLNHVGAQTDIIFDGGSLILNDAGDIIKALKNFKEDSFSINLSELKTKEQKQIKTEVAEINKEIKIQRIHDALVLGIRDYFKKLNFEKAIVGLSGGIDSAVTFALATEALGNKNVKALLMPSHFSSDHSVNDAKKLAENLTSPYDIIPIEELYHSFNKTLKPFFGDLPFDITEENIQARIRGVLSMAYTNKYKYILLNTSNKSEMAVGYGTLYGDMNGGISVLGDVYKTDVFRLANYINRDKEIIPIHTITKPPSAELRPDQKDSDSLPDYDLLDAILFQYIEKVQSIDKIIDQGFDADVVKKVLRLVNMNEFKRHQLAPTLRVSPKAFGRGRRLPIVAKYLS